MAPHHIDDLPRREEREDTRQLMLGLIDELPDERRGTRQLMWWVLVGLAVALFAGGIFVTAPRQNSTVGSGQNASGETARIARTATPLQLSDADYVLVGDQLVIVDPTARRVVALVPQIS